MQDQQYTIQEPLSSAKQQSTIQIEDRAEAQLQRAPQQRQASRSYLDKGHGGRCGWIKHVNASSSNSQITSAAFVGAFDKVMGSRVDCEGQLPVEEEEHASRNTGAGPKHVTGVMSSQTIHQRHGGRGSQLSNQRQKAGKDRATRQDLRQKSTGKIRSILGDTISSQARDSEGEVMDPQNTLSTKIIPDPSMGITFGGDDGFGKFANKLASNTVDCKNSEPEGRPSRGTRRTRKFSKRSPAGTDEGYHLAISSKKELEIIYENELYTQGMEEKNRRNLVQQGANVQRFKTEEAEGSRQPHQELQEDVGKFKQNMLLGFYDWPRIETSAVLTASLRSSIQSENLNSAPGAPSVLVAQASINASSLKAADMNTHSQLRAENCRPNRSKGQRRQRDGRSGGQQQLASKMLLKDVVKNEVQERQRAIAPRNQQAISKCMATLEKDWKAQGADEEGATSRQSQKLVEGVPDENAEVPTRNSDVAAYTVPFLKEIENLHNYQNLKNQQTQSRKRLTTIRNAETKAIVRPKRHTDLTLQKNSRQSKRLSPDTPSQSPFAGEMPKHGQRQVVAPRQRYNSQEGEAEEAVSPKFEQVIQTKYIDKDNLDVAVQIGNSKNMQLPTFGGQLNSSKNDRPFKNNSNQEAVAHVKYDQSKRIQRADKSAKSQMVEKSSKSMARSGSRGCQLPNAIDATIKNSQDELPANTKAEIMEQFPMAKRESFVKIEIGGAAENERDCVYNQKSSSLVQIQHAMQQNFENDRASWRPDHADVTKVGTPELCTSIHQMPHVIHESAQQRISSQSQAAVVQPSHVGSQESGFSMQTTSAAANTRSLQRHVMNDTFSEDAWRKLNTMKLQRQQQQALRQGGGKAKVAQVNPTTASKTLDIVKQKQMTKPGNSTANQHAEQVERHRDDPGESGHGSRQEECNGLSNDYDAPTSEFKPHHDGDLEGAIKGGHCFSSLAREQIALKNSQQIPRATERLLTDRQRRGTNDEISCYNQITERSETTNNEDEQPQSTCNKTKIGFDFGEPHFRQIDATRKSRKSYKRTASNDIDEDELVPRHNSRYQSLGVVAQQNSLGLNNDNFQNIQATREASTKLKATSRLNQMQSSILSSIKEPSVEIGRVRDGKDVLRGEQARMSSCAGEDMKQSMNSVISTGFGDSAASGNAATFKKSDGSSFTYVSSEFQITKTSNDTEKENNQCLLNHQPQLALDSTSCIRSQNGHPKQAKQVFSKQVKTNRIGVDQDQRRRQFSLGNRYATCLQQEKSTTVRQSMQSKGSLELINRQTMSSVGTEGPLMTGNRFDPQKEKLVLPTINTSRKLQIVDVLSFANMNVAGNGSQAIIQNFPSKHPEKAQIQRFSTGCSSLMNALAADCDPAKPETGVRANFNASSAVADAPNQDMRIVADSKFKATFYDTGSQKDTQSVSALQIFHKRKEQIQTTRGADEGAPSGSVMTQALSYDSSRECGAGAVPATHNEAGGCRSLSFRQHLQGSKFCSHKENGKHLAHASVTSAGHLILHPSQIDDKPFNHTKGLRQSLNSLNYNICFSAKNSQTTNVASQNARMSAQRMPINLVGLSKRQSNREVREVQDGSAHYSKDQE